MKRKTALVGFIPLGLIGVSGLNAGKPVQVEGSDTLVDPVQVLAEQYMEKPVTPPS